MNNYAIYTHKYAFINSPCLIDYTPTEPNARKKTTYRVVDISNATTIKITTVDGDDAGKPWNNKVKNRNRTQFVPGVVIWHEGISGLTGRMGFPPSSFADRAAVRR